MIVKVSKSTPLLATAEERRRKREELRRKEEIASNLVDRLVDDREREDREREERRRMDEIVSNHMEAADRLVYDRPPKSRRNRKKHKIYGESGEAPEDYLMSGGLEPAPPPAISLPTKARKPVPIAGPRPPSVADKLIPAVTPTFPPALSGQDEEEKEGKEAAQEPDTPSDSHKGSTSSGRSHKVTPIPAPRPWEDHPGLVVKFNVHGHRGSGRGKDRSSD
ncbi:Uu.00g038680.m01.CDS01 [Anthostomella pinea]|uniref:Uu.00g038680.m01.CDS01 n=1 Tax=Anthostomella pinea TaxID=933095 RepID=A0AAI8YDR5_9PEZI|nr:Uu.00g038680.m01.CDS01 [Anthostomella pinea]